MILLGHESGAQRKSEGALDQPTGESSKSIAEVAKDLGFADSGRRV
jgi:hypothetical protein